MRTPFAALQDRVNRVAHARLTNALAFIGGGNGEGVPVFFDAPYAGPFGGQVDARAPECEGPVEALGHLGRGDSLVIDGATYEVMTAQPDGLGFVRLVLGSL